MLVWYVTDVTNRGPAPLTLVDHLLSFETEGGLSSEDNLALAHGYA